MPPLDSVGASVTSGAGDANTGAAKGEGGATGSSRREGRAGPRYTVCVLACGAGQTLGQSLPVPGGEDPGATIQLDPQLVDLSGHQRLRLPQRVPARRVEQTPRHK